MKYTYNRILPDVPIDEADTRTREALKEQGFGVLTEIDVKETLWSNNSSVKQIFLDLPS